MSSFVSLVGPSLRTTSGSLVDSISQLADKDAVGLYFSAHWCPPCRGFTPKLAESYKAMQAKGLKFEIVFVSSDRDEKAFTEYAEEMPWVSLPYNERELKNKLSSKFKVSGIPTLVILDKDGNTITKDGREVITTDPTGEKFPWVPPTFHECLGTAFEKPDGTPVSFDSALKGKVLGLYFSAHWCPPCRGFTPTFAEIYKKVQHNFPGRFETVFVSSDRDESSFKEYHKEMPWLALPYADRDRKTQLSQRYGVEGIPSLVIVDADTGKVINQNGRGTVANDKNGEKFPWAPELVNSLSEPEGINDSPALIVFATNNNTDSELFEKSLKKAAEEITAEAKAQGQEETGILFFIAKEKDRVAERVAQLTGTDLSKVSTIILDIPDEGGYYDHPSPSAQPSETYLVDFVRQYKAKKLERKQLKA